MQEISEYRGNGDIYIKKVTELAIEAGRILLKSGAEIFRVEETISRICHSFGVECVEVFTLSHALFVSTEYKEETYTKVKAVPLAGAHLGMVAAVNHLSREIAAGKVDMQEAASRLKEIDQMRPVSNFYQIIAAGTTSLCFGAILGAGLAECICAFVIGCAVWAWCIAAKKIHMSKIVVNLIGGVIITALALLALYTLPIPMQLDGMIIGAIMPLIPGITFVNAIRDIADGEFLSGTVRMLDAIFVFVYIAVGVGLVLGVYSNMLGGHGL